MRGRKRLVVEDVDDRLEEEIDNPRMRGRKLNGKLNPSPVVFEKKLIIPG